MVRSKLVYFTFSIPYVSKINKDTNLKFCILFTKNNIIHFLKYEANQNIF